MKDTRIVMGMPVTLEILGSKASFQIMDKVFDYFTYVDEKFSTYKDSSEINLINQGKIDPKDYSPDMQRIFELGEKTKQETEGYFDISYRGKLDPSGIVKGWAIWQAAQILRDLGLEDFYINAGSDVQTQGKNSTGTSWIIGIKNPFLQDQIVKILTLSGEGVATSGNYLRGAHIYNPHGMMDDSVVSLTVIGPNILEADRFATAAFAMGKQGIEFIEKIPGLEGYQIDKNGQAIFTTGFEKYVKSD